MIVYKHNFIRTMSRCSSFFLFLCICGSVYSTTIVTSSSKRALFWLVPYENVTTVEGYLSIWNQFSKYYNPRMIVAGSSYALKHNGTLGYCVRTIIYLIILFICTEGEKKEASSPFFDDLRASLSPVRRNPRTSSQDLPVTWTRRIGRTITSPVSRASQVPSFIELTFWLRHINISYFWLSFYILYRIPRRVKGYTVKRWYDTVFRLYYP